MLKMRMKTNILLVLLSVVGVVFGSLLFSQYYFSEKIAMTSTEHTFELISQNISQHVKHRSREIRRILNTTIDNKALKVPITFDAEHPVLRTFVEILSFKQQLHAIYFAQKNGHYYEVVNLHGKPVLQQTFKAPEKTAWLVITVIDNVHRYTFLDEALELRGEKKFVKAYDPLKRPWYLKTISADRIVSIKPYLLALSRKMGISFAKADPDKALVLGINYTLDQLNSILASQKYDEGSEVFIVNEEGRRYASSGLPEGENPRVSDHLEAPNRDQSYFKDLLRDKLHRIVKYQEGEKHYFLSFHPLLSKNTYLGIRIDADKMLKFHRDNLTYSFLIAFLLLLLAIPLILYLSERIVLPIKKLTDENNKIKQRAFSEVTKIDSHIIELNELSDSLVSMSQSMQKHERAQDALLDSLIKLIAEAIDNKSPHTGKHCERVPDIAMRLLQEANASQSEAFKDFTLESKEELREFEIGAWLHDCGKVTTPSYIIDKAVKLETIYNRIHEIRTRFEVLWRDLQISYLKKEIDRSTLEEKQKRLLDDFAFIASVNIGTEEMDEAKKARVRSIAAQEWERHFDDRLGLGRVEKERYSPREEQHFPVSEKLLSDKSEQIIPRDGLEYNAYEEDGFKVDVPEYRYNLGEIYNLCIERGTLTEEERFKVNEHVIMSIKMLEKIPFPENMSRIVEYAGTHHETLAGTGYPRKLTAAELSIPARIMAIADVFEALTASDRPYKKAKTLSESFVIMQCMVNEQHIDADLFALFLRSGAYLAYAEENLTKREIDAVDIEKYL